MLSTLLLRFLLLLLACYGMILVALFLLQGRFLFLPHIPGRIIKQDPATIGLSFEEVELRTSDDLLLHAWFVPAEQERGTILFCHGNAGNISHRLESLLIFHDLGFSTLIFDYRGYGRSEGHPSEEGTYRDGEAAWDHLTRIRNIPPERIILFGRSLGGGVATRLGVTHHPGALIVESSFTSVPDLAAGLYPLLPARLLCRFRYNNLQRIPRIHCAILIIHSRDDEIIPFSHGQTLRGAAGTGATFLELQGGHNEGFLLDEKRYREGMERFLAPWQP